MKRPRQSCDKHLLKWEYLSALSCRSSFVFSLYFKRVLKMKANTAYIISPSYQVLFKKSCLGTYFLHCAHCHIHYSEHSLYQSLYLKEIALIRACCLVSRKRCFGTLLTGKNISISKNTCFLPPPEWRHGI